MKRTPYHPPSNQRARPASHPRAPTTVPKAPLPFNLPSLRREAGGDGAGGGIAGAGAKWASPRFADAPSALPDALETPAEPDPHPAWRGPRLRAVRATPDFPELGNRPAHHPSFLPSSTPSNPPGNGMTTLHSAAVDRRRAKRSDDVRVHPKPLESPSSQLPVTSDPAPIASSSANPPPAEEDDWAAEGDAIDFSEPVSMPEVTLPIAPPPTSTAPLSAQRPAYTQERARARVPTTHAPPAAHWARAIRLQEEEERRAEFRSPQWQPRPHFDPHPMHSPHPSSAAAPPEDAIDLTVIKDQKSIMRTKAEVAQEARKKAEEERLRLQKERAAQKLRELEERLGVSKSASAAQPAPQQAVKSAGNVVSSPDACSLPTDNAASHVQTEEDTAPSTPRVVLQRPKGSPVQTGHENPQRDIRPEEKPASERVSRENAPTTMRRARNARHSAHEQRSGDGHVDGGAQRRRNYHKREYDGPAENETREQWLERRRRKTETRDAVKSIIEQCINRAVYGARYGQKRGQGRRNVAQGAHPGSGKREYHRREHPVTPPTAETGVKRASPDVNNAGKPPAVAPTGGSSQTAGTATKRGVASGVARGAAPTNHQRVGSEKRPAPPPLRPAPWAKQHQETRRNAQNVASSANMTEVSESTASPDRQVAGAAAANVQTGNSSRDPTPVESTLAAKAVQDNANSKPPSQHRVPSNPPLRNTDSRQTSKSGPPSLSKEVDSVTILPPLGGNVRVLMNPNARRDNREGTGAASRPNGNTVLGTHVDGNGPQSKIRGSPRRRGGKVHGVGRDRRDSPAQGTREAKDSAGQFGAKLPESAVQHDEGVDSAAWNRPSPPTSFDAITRAFSNQPAAFPLVGAPLIPPVPVVPVLSVREQRTSTNFDGKHDVWQSGKPWTGSAPNGNQDMTEWPSNNHQKPQPSAPEVQSPSNTLPGGGRGTLPVPKGAKKHAQRRPINDRQHGDRTELTSSNPLPNSQPAKVDNSGKPKRRPTRANKKSKRAEKMAKESLETSDRNPSVTSGAAKNQPADTVRPENVVEAHSTANVKKLPVSQTAKTNWDQGKPSKAHAVEENVSNGNGRQEATVEVSKVENSESSVAAAADDSSQKVEATSNGPQVPSRNVRNQTTKPKSKRSTFRKRKAEKDVTLKHFITKEGTVVEVKPTQGPKVQGFKAPTQKPVHGSKAPVQKPLPQGSKTSTQIPSPQGLKAPSQKQLPQSSKSSLENPLPDGSKAPSQKQSGESFKQKQSPQGSKPSAQKQLQHGPKASTQKPLPQGSKTTSVKPLPQDAKVDAKVGNSVESATSQGESKSKRTVAVVAPRAKGKSSTGTDVDAGGKTDQETTKTTTPNPSSNTTPNPTRATTPNPSKAPAPNSSKTPAPNVKQSVQGDEPQHDNQMQPKSDGVSDSSSQHGNVPDGGRGTSGWRGRGRRGRGWRGGRGRGRGGRGGRGRGGRGRGRGGVNSDSTHGNSNNSTPQPIVAKAVTSDAQS